MDFFPDKVWLWIVRKWALHRLPKLMYQIGTATFQYSKNFVIFFDKTWKITKFFEYLKVRVAPRKSTSHLAQLRIAVWTIAFFSPLAWSADFLSMIFGIFGKFRIDIFPQKFPKTIFREKYFISKNKSRNFSEHLCRSEIFQRFQKSYLENQPIKLKVRKNLLSKLAVLICANIEDFDVLLRGATRNCANLMH